MKSPTTNYSFIVPGAPVPKGRPRFGQGRAYTPQRTKAYELRVQAYARQAGVQPLEGPVWLTLRIFFPDRRRRDIDNVVKSIADALNGVAYADDDQIARLVVDKFYDSVNPRVEVRLEPAL